MSFVCSFASAKIKSISIYRYLSSAVVFMLLPYVRTTQQYEIQRILRPLVLESLFRASSLGSRYARSNERKRCIPRSLRGTFASSTKYLMQSSWPYIAADMHTVDFTHQISFFLQRNISRCLSDHRMLLVLPLLFPSLAKVSLCRKEIEDSRGVLHSSLFTRLFFITRATIREAVLQHLEITFKCCRSQSSFHPTRTVSLLSPT